MMPQRRQRVSDSITRSGSRRAYKAIAVHDGTITYPLWIGKRIPTSLALDSMKLSMKATIMPTNVPTTIAITTRKNPCMGALYH